MSFSHPKDVAQAMPGAGFVHVFDKRGLDRGLSGLRRVAARIATRQYDLAVIPHRSVRSALLARLARIPERVGFAGVAGSLLYRTRVITSERTFLKQEADLARALGAEPAGMALEPRREWVGAARAALGPSAEERLAAICLGSEWETKIWPASRVASLARLLTARGLRPVLLGGPRERAMAQEVNCGSKFVIVPLATRKAVDQAVPDRAKVDALFSAAACGTCVARRRQLAD